jgi:hypothetical protein
MVITHADVFILQNNQQHSSLFFYLYSVIYLILFQTNIEANLKFFFITVPCYVIGIQYCTNRPSSIGTNYLGPPTLIKF